MHLDARVPVVFGEIGDAGPEDALLIAGDAPAPKAMALARYNVSNSAAHQPGCLCCLPRGAAALALGRLFLARSRGEVGFFRRVLVVAQDPSPVLAALASDPLVSGRFRFSETKLPSGNGEN